MTSNLTEISLVDLHDVTGGKDPQGHSAEAQAQRRVNEQRRTSTPIVEGVKNFGTGYAQGLATSRNALSAVGTAIVNVVLPPKPAL